MTPRLLPAEFANRVKRLRWILLLVWGSTTFCAAFFARDFNFTLLGGPFGFWMAAQGSVLIFFGHYLDLRLAGQPLGTANAIGS